MKYKRILLKLSGESLMGDKQFGIDNNRLSIYADQIKRISDKGVEVAIVIGGGNIFRGVQAEEGGMDRTHGDYMGMLATMINAMALQSSLEAKGVNTRLQSAIEMKEIAEPYVRRRAVRHLEKGRVVIFGAGTGNPYFTTDSAASLRAIEIEAEVILKGTRVDGVYSSDPEKDPTATKYDMISFDDVYGNGLKVMDMTAFTLCKENDLPIIVFDMDTEGNLERVLNGEQVGTIVRNQKFNCKAMTEDLQMVYDELKSSNKKTISHLEQELLKIRAGKASPTMLQGVLVDYYGSPTPLQQVANVNTIDARTITVQPWEKPMLDPISKGIINSNLGFAPQNNGEILIISVPPLTEERRRELVKRAKAEGEHAKVGLRNNRKDALDMIKSLKDDGLSEDMQKDAENEVQNITNSFVVSVDKLVDAKEVDVMTI